jgi:hypothetical protein
MAVHRYAAIILLAHGAREEISYAVHKQTFFLRENIYKEQFIYVVG